MSLEFHNKRRAIFALALIFFTVSTPLFCSTPRLLIGLGPKCTFTPEELKKKIDVEIVTGTTDEMRDKIKEYDACRENHVTVLKDNAEALSYLAWDLGYDALTLNEDLESAVKTLNVVMPSIPLTDANLPRMDPREVGLFYNIMMRVDRIFRDHNIHYWATCGTLLGAVRHGGMVPWDDDIDVCMMEEEISRLLGLREVLAAEGLELYYRPDFGFYKIYPTNGIPVTKEETFEVCPWKFPFVDVFPMRNENGRVEYARKVWRDIFPREYYLPEDVLSYCPELPFGPMTIPSPSHNPGYLTQMYGEDWNRVAYVKFCHRNECGLKTVKVDLLDRSPPKYVLPK